MSGAEVIGIIAGIIAIIEATIKISKAANDASGLPEAFRDVALRLPLVSKTLQKFSENKITSDDEWHKAMEPVLQRCKDRATKLQKIFYDVVPQAGASRMKRYALATLTWGKGDTVKSLMKRILEDVQLLTGNRVAELPTQTGVAAVIQEAIERVSAISPSLPKGTHPSPLHNNERDSLLKELKWTDPTIDKQRIERTKGYLHEASSKWILSHPDYLKWRDGESKLLWIKGGAGKGKTMLLVTITGKLRSQTRLDPTKLDHPTGNSVLSFFFCQNTDNRLNNAVAVLKGLIYLLLSQDVNLVPYLKSECDRMGTGIFDVTNNNVNAFDALSNVFRQMIQHPRSEPMYLAVDALDECEDGLPDLLGLVRETALQENRLKWILTSRNRVDIEQNLALESSEAKLSLELNSEAVSQAIENYIDYKVARVSSLRSSPAQQAEIRQKLLEKAEGTFLWVDLALRSLHTVLADDAVRRLNEMPPGLPVLYDRMMGDIAKSTSDYRDSCLDVLSVATLAYRPLHILELRTLAGLRHGTADLERIIDMCGSFLTLVDNYVYPIHQSAKDYLVDDAAIEKIFPSGKHAVQRSIVDRSVAAMQKTLGQDVYQLEHPGTLIRDVETRPPTSDPLLGVGYSCTYWIDHVCETDMADSQGSQHSLLSNASGQDIARSENSVQIGNLITPFFQDHFLHWLEALSLLGAVSNAVLSLLRLRTIVAARIDASADLVEDAYRFILQNWWIIEQAPLQTYVSALLFTPLDSIIRRMFAKEEPGWVLTKPRVDKFWSPCLQTFEGHSDWVMSVALSSDGSRIVSGSCDETVRIWDTKSGKEILRLEGHNDNVLSVAFSLDNSRIISGSADKTIRIWDTKSGKEILRLEGHNDNVLSVAFSSDNSRIVSGSRDETVRIWDIKSGKEIRKLEGHNGWVRSVGFLDDSRIVSGSNDRTICIWDIKSGKEIQKLKGHSESVYSVAFSSDGNRIISGSYDSTIRIWDIKSGKETQKLEGHSDSVNSIVSSSDGSRIVSGSSDLTIRIWDIKSGKEIQKFEGHNGWVRSVGFLDDSRIVSGSGDRTICIWDIKSGKTIQRLEDYSGLALSIVFSRDGSQIASGGDYDKTICIWDAKSGEKVRSIKMDSPVFTFRFEDSGDSGLWLHSDAGSIKVQDGGSGRYDDYSVIPPSMINYNGRSTLNPQTPPSSETGSRWGLRGEGLWITWRGRGAIWLPPDFRPLVSDVSRDGSTIAIGCPTGRVVILRMSMDVSF